MTVTCHDVITMYHDGIPVSHLPEVPVMLAALAIGLPCILAELVEETVYALGRQLVYAWRRAAREHQ